MIPIFLPLGETNQIPSPQILTVPLLPCNHTCSTTELKNNFLDLRLKMSEEEDTNPTTSKTGYTTLISEELCPAPISAHDSVDLTKILMG